MNYTKLFLEAGKSSRPDAKIREQPQDRTREGARLRCVNCLHAITSADQQISVDGSFEHTFTNPHNLSYRLGCFRHAPGCLLYGEPTPEWSWFPGCNWCYALCAECGEHLGWHYSAADNEFYGLILRKLITRP